MSSQSAPQAEFEQLSPTAYRVEVTVPSEEVRRKLDAAYSELAKSANIPGFRPGKAPRHILDRHFGKDRIRNEAQAEIIEQTLWPFLKERELTLIGRPRLDDKAWKDNEEFQYVVTMEVLPSIPEIDYAELKAVLPEREVTDEDVVMELRRFRIMFGTRTGITDRSTKEGDFVMVDLEGEVPDVTINTVDGEVPWGLKENGMEIELGSGKALEGLEDVLTGAELEEIRDFELTLPDDFPDRKVRGKKLAGKARVKVIEERELADLTDELIKEKLGDQGIETLDGLKERIRQEISSVNTQADERAKRDQLERHLSRTYEFPLPEGMVRAEYENIMDRSLAALRDRGVDIDELVKLESDQGQRMRKRARYQAERVTGLNLLWNTVARREAIRVGNDEVANYIMMLGYRQGLKEQDIKMMIQDPQFMMSIHEDLLQKKAVHFLLSKMSEERVPKEEFREMAEDAQEEAEESQEKFVDVAEDPLISQDRDYLASGESATSLAEQTVEKSGSE